MSKLVFLFGAILISSVVAGVFCVQNTVAIDGPYKVNTTDVQEDSNPLPCKGWYQEIAVSGEASTRACITGDSVQIARFFSAQGPVMYAIKFPSDGQFYGIDICHGQSYCTYSEVSDTLLAYSHHPATGSQQGALFKNFTQTITKYPAPSGIGNRYRLDKSPDFILSHPAGTAFNAKSLALSANGKWAAIEVVSYGVYLVNTETFSVRRVKAPGNTYGYGFDPVMQMAVSNRGDEVMTTGRNLGLSIIRVDPTCGDFLSLTTERYYFGAARYCAIEDIDTTVFIPNFHWGSVPVYFGDDTALSFVVHSYQGLVKRVVLSEAGLDDASGVAYVALGDSFSSGEGETDDSYYIGGPQNACHVSGRSYPYLLGEWWSLTPYSFACSGATLAEIMSDDNTSQLSRLHEHMPQLVSLGAGGNDAGLIGKLKDCIGLDTCKWASDSEMRALSIKEIGSLYSPLVQAYEKIKSTTGAKIIAIGYPQIITAIQNCPGVVGTMLNQIERRYIGESLVYLNAVIDKAARDSGVGFAAVGNAFDTHQLCSESSTPAMNAIRFGDDIAPISGLPTVKVIGAESFHPTPFGQYRVAQTIHQQYPQPELSEVCVWCGDGTGAPVPDEYWDADLQNLQPDAPSLKHASFYSELSSGEMRIALPKNTATPQTEVAVGTSIQDEVTWLVSNDDGSVEGSLFTEDIKAAGAIFVKLLSPSGERVAYYDFTDTQSAEEVVTPVLVSSGPPHEPVSASVNLPATVTTTSKILLPTRNVARNTSSIQQEVMGVQDVAASVSKPTPLPVNAQTKDNLPGVQETTTWGVVVLLSVTAAGYFLVKVLGRRGG